MGFVHGKNTFVSVGGSDLSTFTNQTSYNRSADSHDVTTYGKNAKVYAAGLKDGTATITGTYDNGVAGPRAILRPLLGATNTVTFIFRPEGTGAGKPQDSVAVFVTAYEETNPVADMISWSATLQFSDDVTTTTQS